MRRAGVACFRDRIWVWQSLVGAALLSGCGFPKYDFTTAIGSGGADGGGSGASAGVGNGAGGVPGAGSGGAAPGGGGVGGGLLACPAASAGSGGAPVAVTHCSDLKKDGDETGLDCGGPVCSICFHSETCQHDSDCISDTCAAGACQPFFDLELDPVVLERDTNTLQFLIKLNYLGPGTVQLKDVLLRYYFSRGDVADPVVPYTTNATLNSTDIGSQTRWDIVRVLSSDKAVTDSYLEVTFTSNKYLITGDVVDLTQSIQNGSAAGHPFDQLTHWSFQNVPGYNPDDNATVFLDGELAWGKAAPYAVPEQCFFTAVNFAGEAFMASGHDFQAGAAPIVQFSGAVFHADANAGLSPTPDTVYAAMLNSAIVLDTAGATLNVPNGGYWFYPYVISGDGANTADLLVQGTRVATFSAEAVAGAPAWSKLGPYAVSVTNGKIVLASSGGAVRLAGAELYQAAQ